MKKGLIASQTEQAPEQNPELSPEEIEQFKKGYQIAKQFFYQEQVFDALTQEVQGNPVTAIAGLVVTAMLRVQEEAGQFSLPVAFALGLALIDDVAGTLEESGVLENSSDLQTQVLMEATNLWLQSNNYPPEEVAQALQDIGAPPEAVAQMQQAPQEQGAMM